MMKSLNPSHNTQSSTRCTSTRASALVGVDCDDKCDNSRRVLRVVALLNVGRALFAQQLLDVAVRVIAIGGVAFDNQAHARRC